MLVRRDSAWWYWAVMSPLVAGAILGCKWSLVSALGLAAVQTAHFAVRAGSLTAFPVQVRAGYLALLALGMLPGAGAIHWIQFCGTSAMVLAGYCPLARTLSLLPWNRSEALTVELVLRAFFSLHPGGPTPGCSAEAATGAQS